MSAVIVWKEEGKGPQWVPALHFAETEMGFPTDLLARIAYEESHFREDIIRGLTPSPDGALGLMQLMPRWFTSVRRQTPFSDSDVGDQIEEAAHFVSGLFRATQDWELTIAAYNAGLGNVLKYGTVPPFKETQQYVADILADLPGIT